MTIEEGHRLVAIMRVDAVASTAWLSQHGVQESIDARHRSHDAVLSVSARGRVLDTRGDGSIVAFESIADALTAGWGLQHDTIRPRTDPDFRVAVTIGELHRGELTAAIDDHSKRVEAACPPGQVLVDGATKRAARDITGFRFENHQIENRDIEVENDTTHIMSRASATVEPLEIESRLEAVLFSDIASTDGTPAREPLSSTHELARRCATNHGGEVLDTNRAGIVAVFESCTDAMRAADAMHRSAASNALDVGAQTPARFRIALTVGEVTHADGSVFGSTVVECARLLDLASEPCTLTSSDVVILGGPRSDHDATHLGTIELRGLQGSTSALRFEPGESVENLIVLPPDLARDHSYPFVGRSAERAIVEATWDRTLQGEVTSLIISGEEGIGKTRLVQQLAHQAHQGGAIVLHGACVEDVRVPYRPLAQALVRAATLDPELDRAATELTGPLGLLLAPAAEKSLAALDPATTTQSEVAEALVGTLHRLAGRRPMLLVIDDLQWADSATTRLLLHVITNASSRRMSVVTTCRTGRHEPGQLTELSEARRHGPRHEHLPLDRLAAAEISDLLASRAGSVSEVDADDVGERLAEMSGGSPLYLQELIEHLTTAGSLTFSESGGWQLELRPDDDSIPTSVIDLVAHRAQRLGPETASLLAHAAVIGNTFELDVLAEVTDRPMHEVLDGVEAADRARLVHESETGGSCVFADEVVRAAMLRELGPSRRAVVHEATARALEELRPAEIDRLASHWDAAMGATARSKAVDYALLAGKRDMSAAAWEASIDRHRRVLDLLGHQSDEIVAGEAHHALGLSLRRIGDDAHRAALTRSAEIARTHELGDLLGRSAIAMMRPGSWYPEADVVDQDIVAMCEDALLLLGDSDPMRARVLAALATNLTFADEPERCFALVEEAQSLARTHGDLRLIGTTLAAELISFHAPDRFERRRQLADEVRHIGRATGDRDLLFVGSCFVVADLFASGEIDKAEHLITEVSALTEKMRQYFPSFLVGQFRVTLAIARSAPDAAELVTELREQNEANPVGWFGVNIIQTAAIADSRGNLSEMLVSLFAAAGEYEVPSWARKWNYALSRAYLETGDHAAALAAIEMNPEPDFDNYWLASLYHVGLLGLETKDPTICESVIEKLSPYRGRFALIGLSVCMAGQISTALGQAHQGLGRLNEAAELFREAMEQADGLDFPFYATLARRSLAQVLLRIDSTNAEAPALLRQAVATADRFGFELELRRATALLETSAR